MIDPSKSDEWMTPRPIFEALDARFRFGWDACATGENALVRGSGGSPLCWTKDMDALSQDWVRASQCGAIWCNPPYSKPNLSIFPAFAAEQARKGATVVLFVPASTSEAWFQDAFFRGFDVLGVEAIPSGPIAGWGLRMSGIDTNLWLHFLKGRVSFGYDGKKKGIGAKKGSVIAAFSPKNRRDAGA